MRRLQRVAILLAAAGLAAARGGAPPAKPDPQRIQNLLRQAGPLWEQGRCGAATPLLEEIVKSAPELPDPYFALAACYAQTDRPLRAEPLLRRYLEFKPQSVEGWALLGVALTAGRDFAHARPAFEQCLRLDPHSEAARKGLARVLLAQGDANAAWPYLEPLLAEAAPEEDVFVLAARAQLRLGANREALEWCERGLERYPQSDRLERMSADLLVECGREAPCRRKLEARLERQPKSPLYLRAVAELYLDYLPRDPAARQMVDRNLNAFPDDPMTHYLLARWSLENYYPEAGRDEATATAALAGIEPELRAKCVTLAGIAEKKLDNFAAAEKTLREANRLNRELPAPDPHIALYLVDVLLIAAKRAEAVAVAREAVAWNPHFAPSHLWCARALLSQDELEEAAREAETALRLGMPEDQERGAHAVLASAYFQLGREEEAQKHQEWAVTHAKPQ